MIATSHTLPILHALKSLTLQIETLEKQLAEIVSMLQNADNATEYTINSSSDGEMSINSDMTDDSAQSAPF